MNETMSRLRPGGTRYDSDPPALDSCQAVMRAQKKWVSISVHATGTCQSPGVCMVKSQGSELVPPASYWCGSYRRRTYNRRKQQIFQQQRRFCGRLHQQYRSHGQIRSVGRFVIPRNSSRSLSDAIPRQLMFIFEPLAVSLIVASLCVIEVNMAMTTNLK
ncbi:hypothetical protein J6590_001898 [Homalodisca vitripennis]|nr:hypothetical protein J6590_001898 [Homalodisca vitripennis]